LLDCSWAHTHLHMVVGREREIHPSIFPKFPPRLQPGLRTITSAPSSPKPNPSLPLTDAAHPSDHDLRRKRDAARTLPPSTRRALIALTHGLTDR